ncbi:ATP binding protein [Ditylenchus destructor]|nr:ATP binding protein [Ditylenchus destructor]
MVALETPSANILTKMDLLTSADKGFVEMFLDGDIKSVLDQPSSSSSTWNNKHRKLTESIATVLEDYSLVKFLPLNVEDEDTITELLMVIDSTIQYGEDADVKDRFPEEMDDDT